jgi:hypothetical protein
LFGLCFLLSCAFIGILGAWHWFFTDWNCKSFCGSTDLSFCTWVPKAEIQSFESWSWGWQYDTKVFPTITTDCSICCPGLVVRGYPKYLTPQSNKGKTLPQPLSRTPYTSSVSWRSIKVIYWLSLQLVSILPCMGLSNIVLRLKCCQICVYIWV